MMLCRRLVGHEKLLEVTGVQPHSHVRSHGNRLLRKCTEAAVAQLHLTAAPKLSTRPITGLLEIRGLTSEQGRAWLDGGSMIYGQSVIVTQFMGERGRHVMPIAEYFISYTSADKARAEWIGWVLEEAGASVRLQAWDFVPGSNLVLEMQRAAPSAQRTIAVLSSDYLKSRFAAPEWAAAFAQDPEGLSRAWYRCACATARSKVC